MDSSQGKSGKTHRSPYWFHDEHGMEAIEFALVGAVMTVLIVAAIPLLGGGIYSVFESVITAINSVSTPGG